MNKKYIIANWKSHPDSLAEAEQILDSINDYFETIPEQERSLVICPPFVFMEEVAKILQTSHLAHNAELGAQDIAFSESGALTGEVSGPMLKKLGVRYVIIGHSERRWKLNESDEAVNKKLKTALKDEFVPIVCVGERERNAGYKDFLGKQIETTFAGLSADDIGKCLIAYEPVWAISSNPDARPDTPENTLEAISVIQNILNSKFQILNSVFLYGGSVTSKNAKDFLLLDQIAGVLVGGASVVKEEFIEILKAV